MGKPVVASAAVGNSSMGSGTVTCPLPAGSVAGSLIVHWIWAWGSTPTLTPVLSGWNTVDVNHADPSTTTAVFYRYLTGAETSLDFTYFPSSGSTAAIALRVTGAQSGNPFVGSVLSATNQRSMSGLTPTAADELTLAWLLGPGTPPLVMSPGSMIQVANGDDTVGDLSTAWAGDQNGTVDVPAYNSNAQIKVATLKGVTVSVAQSKADKEMAAFVAAGHTTGSRADRQSARLASFYGKTSGSLADKVQAQLGSGKIKKYPSFQDLGLI